MTKNLKKLIAGCWTLLVLSFQVRLIAEVPEEIQYQGRLREYAQAVTGTRTMNFKIYQVPSGGVPVWSSGDVVVTVTTGTFSYTLSPGGAIDWRKKDYWLETTVSGKILSPREKIGAVVYALHTRTAEDISKSSGVVRVRIDQVDCVSITTSAIDAGGLVVSNVATPVATNQAATKGYVEAWLPVGTILVWGGSQASIPTGWLLCDGSAISRTTYSRLFQAIGTTHGVGDGVTTFNLPNLRDRFIVGAGSAYSVGNTGGANTVTLSIAEIPSHNHTGTTGTESNGHTHSGTTSSDGAHSHTFTFARGDQDGASLDLVRTSNRNDGNFNGWGTSTAGGHTHSFTTGGASASHTHSFTTASTGGGGAHENRPPYYALCYIIKY